VHAVIVHADLPESMQQQTVPLLVPSPAIKQPLMPYCLARDEACFVGEPVAIVVAESRYVAEDAAALVAIDYEPLPAISDCAKALAQDASRAHRNSPDNLAGFIPIKVGNADLAFAQAPHVFREKIFQHRGGPFFMECRGMIAVPDPATDALTVYVSSQGPHRHKQVLLDLMDWADHQLRIVTPDVGGGFGPKGSFYAEYGALAAAALKLRRPIKWIEDRRENFLATQQERDQHWDVEIAVDDEARILALRGSMIHDAGAYMPWGVVLPWIAATSVTGPYVIPNFHLDVSVAFTNKADLAGARRRPAGSRRGDGAADGSRRARVETRPRRGAVAQFHQARADALQGRGHFSGRPPGHLRQWRLSDLSSQGAGSGRLQQLSRPPGGGAQTKGAISGSASAMRSRPPGSDPMKARSRA
jgi:carbon-monoxide dehydrogenase large subunit